MLEFKSRLWRHAPVWERLLLLVGLVAALSVLSSCGSSSSTVAPTITISCNPSDVTVLGTSQCTATVLNESSTLVNWSVSSSSGSSSGQIGSIDSGGLYTAPKQVPTNNVVTVTATSQVASSLTATQNLTLEQATQIAAVTCDDESTGLPVTVVSSGNSLVCTATASTGATVAVNWTVANANSKLGGNVGSIPATGVYIAPLVPPPGSVVTITATSQSLSTIAMSINVTVIFGNNVLSGDYAFSTSGRLTNKSFWARAGSLSVGGGSLSGIEDTNQGGTPNIVTPNRTFSGSYLIGSDGRGTMQFCESAGSGSQAPPSCPLGSGAATSFFRVVVVSPTLVQLIEFSSPQTSAALLTAGGEMLSQDSSVFSSGGGILSGVYSLALNGVSSAGVDEAAAGDFAANGFGTISAGSGTAPGQIDLNVSGSGNTTTTLPATTYAVSSNGRGTMVLNGLTFAFYPVSASRARFIEIDPVAPLTPQSSILLGDAYLQQAAQSCAWGNNALSGATVLETTGLSSGIVTQDLAGFTPSAGAVSGVSMDQNSGGVYTQPSGSPGDNYTITPCGRGTLSIGAHSYVYYIIAPSDAVLLETTSGVEAYGFLLPSTGGPFALTTLSGSYAFRLGGTDAAGAAGDREDFVGQLTSPGTGSGLTGTLDQNDFGATTGSAGAAIAAGTYTAPGGLRATVSLPVATSPATTRNLVLYMVSPTLFYALDVDQAPAGTALGVVNNQF